MNEKFIVTRELGRLAKWLRILGFDTAYHNIDNVSTLIITALREDRIILTRNTKIGQHKGIKIIKIDSDFVKKQLTQVLGDLKISPRQDLMFSRCIICNKELIAIEKTSIKDKVPEFVYNTQEEFVSCPVCGRIYWQGTHWGNVSDTLKDIL